MYKYTCSNENCDWVGDTHQVNWVMAYQFMNLPEPSEDQEDAYEEICVCPKCEPYQLAYEQKLY